MNLIEEAKYPRWVSNIVMVPKRNGKIKVFIYFIDLNKVFPMHPYPIPCIYDLVDATSGYERMPFLDAFFGYNQITMHEPDIIHTSFVTNKGLYCYRVMPIDLKNVRATYQKVKNHILHGQIGRMVEVYIDDMSVSPK